MATDSDIKRLTTFAAFTSLPEPEREWLAAHGTVRRLEPGDVLYGANGEGEDLRAVFVVLSGRFSHWPGCSGGAPERIWRREVGCARKADGILVSVPKSALTDHVGGLGPGRHDILADALHAALEPS